jgi:hypothetical protein
VTGLGVSGFFVFKFMAKRHWWFKFDFKVWRTDSKLRRCSLETRAFWLEVLCIMHETDEAELSGSYEELARLVGCETNEVARCVAELKRTDTADVTLGHGIVTLMSRRFLRELKDRKQSTLRKQRQRCHADVTPESHNRVISKKKEVRKEEEEETPQAAPPPKKGKRIPDEFLLTAEMKDWAGVHRPNTDLHEETMKFVNYYRSKTGRDATKLDWERTWQNWILNARGGGNGNGSNIKPFTKRTDEDVKRESEEFIKQKFGIS